MQFFVRIVDIIAKNILNAAGVSGYILVIIHLWSKRIYASQVKGNYLS